MSAKMYHMIDPNSSETMCSNVREMKAHWQ